MFQFFRKSNGQIRILHAVERHEVKDQSEINRRQKAFDSWDVLYKSGAVIPRHYVSYARDATEIGDRRALPYLKDLLSFSYDRAGRNDIIMFTNDDNPLHPQLPEMVMRHVSIYGACSSHRCEFRYHLMPSMDSPPDVFARRSERHMGRDLFAFGKEWLEANWDGIPDFILGASDWDLCLAAMIRHQKGFKTTKGNYLEIIPCCELPLGYVLHEWHPPRWSDPDNVNTAPSQLHNRRLFRDWCHKHKLNLEFSRESTLQ